MKLNFSSIDIIFTAYIALTALLLLSFNSQLEAIGSHLAVRAFIVLFIIALLQIETKWIKSKLFQFIRHAYPLLFITYFYTETDYLNNIFFPNLDEIVIAWEHSLFEGMPSISFYRNLPQTWFSELMNMGYASYYFLITACILIIFIKQQKQYERAVFIILNAFLIYYLVFILFPVSGPQYHLEAPLNTIANSGFFRSLVLFAEGLGEAPTAAFPSSHVGIAVVVQLLLVKSHKTAFYTILPFSILICFSTVYIKAHYAVDVLAGLISGIILFWVSSLSYKFISQRNNNKYINKKKDLIICNN